MDSNEQQICSGWVFTSMVKHLSVGYKEQYAEEFGVRCFDKSDNQLMDS